MRVRQVLAPVVGVIVGSVVVALVEAAGHAVYPAPSLGEARGSAMPAMVTIPFGAAAFVVAGWWLGTVAGASAAVKVVGGRPLLHAGIVTGVLLLATVANLVMLPHPPWMVVLGPLGILAAGWLASRL